MNLLKTRLSIFIAIILLTNIGKQATNCMSIGPRPLTGAVGVDAFLNMDALKRFLAGPEALARLVADGLAAAGMVGWCEI